MTGCVPVYLPDLSIALLDLAVTWLGTLLFLCGLIVVWFRWVLLAPLLQLSFASVFNGCLCWFQRVAGLVLCSACNTELCLWVSDRAYHPAP